MNFNRKSISIFFLILLGFISSGYLILTNGPTTLTQTSQTRWMKADFEFLKDKTLSQITLPGAHNAGAYNLSLEVSPDIPQIVVNISRIKRSLAEKLGSNIFGRVGDLGASFLENTALKISKKWAETQSMDIYGQLNSGIRYLDLRIFWDKKVNDFRFHHSLLGEKFKIGLSQIKEFSQKYPEEILMVNARLDHADTAMHEQFKKLILDELSDKLLEKNNGLTKTYESIIKSNKNIICFVSGQMAESEKLLWNSNIITNKWANVDQCKKLFIIQNKFIKNYNPMDNKLFKLQWVLSPQDKTIINSLNPLSKIKNLKDLSAQCNIDLKLFLEYLAIKKFPINIIIVDFFEAVNLVELVRNFNKKQLS